MEIKLLHHTPLEIADIAICKCYGNNPHTDKEKAQARINRVANVSKHASTIEHLYYNFDIDGISRAVLQELCRHRVASYTVKSSRYTLQELKGVDLFISNDEYDFNNINHFCVLTDNRMVNLRIAEALVNLQDVIISGTPNDIAKYCMPESYRTSLSMSINARALQNFLELRSSKHALKEIQDLARAMYEALPEDHKFLFDGIFDED